MAQEFYSVVMRQARKVWIRSVATALVVTGAVVATIVALR